MCAGGGRRAAVRRLGAEVPDHDAVGRPAEAAVRNERHLAAWVREPKVAQLSKMMFSKSC